jgi:hypothetical protein
MLNLSGSTGRSQIMRSILFGVIMLSASVAVVDTAKAEKHRYVQAFINHRQPIPVSQGKLNGVDGSHPNEDALTRRIEQDKIRLDRLIEICPDC